MHLVSQHRLLSSLVGTALCIAGSASIAQSDSSRWLHVDMPQGGCSLTVRQDGAASIHYGAMPRWVRVASKTFNYRQLTKELLGKSYTQGARGPGTGLVGSISLPRSEELRYIDDDGYVRSLIARAWKRRVLPSSQQEIEDYKWVANACALGQP